MNATTWKRPAAWLPLLMSLAALALVLGYVATHNITNQAPHDEGPAARLFQLLLFAQLPIAAYFALTRLPAEPKAAASVLALQAAAWLTALATLLYFES